MSNSETYQSDHVLAKGIICTLYMIVGAASIETGNPYVALVLGTALWFFGINATAYIIESLRGHPHCHNRI